MALDNFIEIYLVLQGVILVLSAACSYIDIAIRKHKYNLTDWCMAALFTFCPLLNFSVIAGAPLYIYQSLKE